MAMLLLKAKGDLAVLAGKVHYNTVVLRTRTNKEDILFTERPEKALAIQCSSPSKNHCKQDATQEPSEEPLLANGHAIG